MLAQRQEVPTVGPEARGVAAIWWHREAIEHEAAALFEQLAALLRQTGAPAELIAMATQAADDEREHAVLCRAIIAQTGVELPPRRAEPPPPLGPTALSPRERALYAAVAISCVTETLSAALLLAIRERAEPALIKETVQRILKDEVAHSRLGWALLAHEAEHGGQASLGWLAAHLPEMVAEAIAADVDPMSEAGLSAGDADEAAPRLDLSAYGILRRERVAEVVSEAVATVIMPGLERFGIDATALRR